MHTVKTLDIPPLHPCGKGYRIVFETQKSSPQKNTISKTEWKCFEDLYVKVQEDAKKHIETLKQFYQRYPEVPEVANLLAFGLLKTKQKKEAEELIEKTHLKHPDHLPARLNYADQCLRLRSKEKIPEIFNHCFDLNRLYPDKECFYYSEFRGFMILMGFYHLEIGEKEKAEEYYQLAFQVDPLHPSVAALEKRLLKKSLLKKFWRVLQNLARISKNP